MLEREQGSFYCSLIAIETSFISVFTEDVERKAARQHLKLPAAGPGDNKGGQVYDICPQLDLLDERSSCRGTECTRYIYTSNSVMKVLATGALGVEKGWGFVPALFLRPGWQESL